MKTLLNRIHRLQQGHHRSLLLTLLTVTALLFGPAGAYARGGRCYGVSSSPAGRGTAYTSSRGGSAYVGPRVTAAQGPQGRTAVATQRGAAYAGPHGAAVVGPNRAVVAARPVSTGHYIRTVPPGARVVYYGGYNCYYVGGIYYRPVFYDGSLVYTVVNP